jgi:oligoendopeptidase F
MKNTFAKDITWDLSDLYISSDSPRIEEDLKLAETKAIHFKEKYKPLFETLIEKAGSNRIPSFPLKSLLQDYKEIVTLMTKPAVFSHLSFAAKTNNTQTGAFLQKIQTRLTEIQSHFLFFEVYWNKLENSVVENLLHGFETKEDRHFLEKLRVYAPHTLLESEENIMAIKSNTSGRAFSRLFDEIVNNIPFFIEIDGKKEKKNKSEVLSLLHSRDREERKKSSESLANGLKEHSHLLVYIYNMILADHRSNSKIRKHNHPMEPMNLSNEINLKSVLNLIQSVKKAYPMASRFYHLKKRLLGLNKLYDYDRYAPIDLGETKVDFNQCREIVLSGYYDFSEEVGKIVEQFFTKRWIDAEIRDGKHGGGFCAQTTPDLHPYILVNYTGSMRDVMTVAHELGHGLHQYMAAKRVGILESDAPLTMAETASVFGEMLIFEKILADQKDPKKRLALICGKIDDHFATVFRQIAMTDFELKSHTEGLEKGELSNEKFSEFWVNANGELYGDSVELSDHYQHGWKYIPHFIHSPFYCYAYAFAQLFVLSLYQKYKEDKKSFIPKYLEMLSLGGSRKPEELAAIVGLNIRDPKFWDSGLHLLDNFVKQAEELAQGEFAVRSS